MNSKLLMIVSGVVLLIVVAAGIFLFMDKSKNNNAQPSASPSNTNTPLPSGSFSSSASPTFKSSFSPSPSASNSANNVLSVDPTTEQANTLRRFNLALDRTKDWGLWKSNAQFSGLVISFLPDLGYNTANEVYIFDSADDAANHYTVSVAESTNNTLRAVIPVADYQGVLKPINRSYWKASYVDALIVAMANGGKSFTTNNAITNVELVLRRADPSDYLYWIVKFNTNVISNSLTVKVDASTKAVAQ